MILIRFNETKMFATFVFHKIWAKVFKNGPSKIRGRQPLKHLKGADHILSNALKAVFHEFYWVHS